MAEVIPKQVELPLVMALDIGTSSVRALLFDRQGSQVSDSLARRPLSSQTSAEGAFLMDADQILGSVWSCIDETLARAGELVFHIAGVGCCTFVSNVLGVDRFGRAITPLFTYADTRGIEEVGELRAQLDEYDTLQRTGCVFHTSYLPARFLWLSRAHPELMLSEVRWMSIGEYLALRLFGQTAISYSVASWTGLLDQRCLDWDQSLLSLLPIDKSQLSHLVDIDQPWKGLQGEFSRRWPSLGYIPWFPAAGDGATANIGSGCARSDRLAVTMGTTTALRVVLQGNISSIPKGLWCYRVSKAYSLLGGALSEGGNIAEWMQQNLKLDNASDVENALVGKPPGKHGLIFLPLLAGERSPGWRGEARGVISGLSLATQVQDIYAAGLEGIVCRMGIVYQLLHNALSGEPDIIASGGAFYHSPVLLQMTADALGRPVRLTQVPEVSARGAAMLALCALGAASDLDDFPIYNREVVIPDPNRHARYQELIQRQQELYNRLISG